MVESGGLGYMGEGRGGNHVVNMRLFDNIAEDSAGSQGILLWGKRVSGRAHLKLSESPTAVTRPHSFDFKTGGVT